MAIRTWLDRFGRDVVTVEGSVKRDLGATRHFLATPSRPVFLPNLEGGPAVANLWSTRERVAGALGIQPNQFLSLPHVIKCAHVSQRFERAAKSSFRLFS